MKKLLNFIILSSVALLFNGCISGWGWLVPYNLQPSYHKFKKMCKLNELPNNKEKYNKILGYFDTDLESLDWEELNKKTWKISEDSGDYKKGVFEYATLTKKKQLNSRARMVASFLSNEAEINRYNINQMAINISWHTRRYHLEQESMTSYHFYWDEETLSCVDVAKENMTPKGANNEK
ncbi:hypothetical protein LS80_011025 [Helicobacter trogontum]|uniref:Uncharacterized protein n=1 Tax=Helicobacter trogontum TaxID=50960 RepID=A0A4U8SYR8_9HELI|nr:hypothetical protein [Helicobacter trogontum]TLD92189.1 hypothetical protein LS80_011025 [Helicobacter trogontum]